MVPVNVALPAELVSVAKLDQGDISLGVAKIIALELFREGVVSVGRAAELCGSPLAAFILEQVAEPRTSGLIVVVAGY